MNTWPKLDVVAMNTKLDIAHRLAVEGYVGQMKRTNGVLRHHTQLVEVPFPDGTFPWGQSVSGPQAGELVELKPLSSFDAAHALSAEEPYAYVRRYYPGTDVPAEDAEAKHALHGPGLALVKRHNSPQTLEHV
ncbi:hypothetical protein BD311DRAFT_778148 [Dichomitus squalens]|uniref:Mug135-like C-terminal domain-containing protein n=1 Tax=Dichomitus squalens TaxID=114155 RepID=A0A4V2K0E4_9APHY|nr:hypothetical protein BD311DRAFT_778148 [Dichomitus squalens]